MKTAEQALVRSGEGEASPDQTAVSRRSWQWLARACRPDRLSDLALAARAGLLYLTAVLLIGLCAALAAWSARPVPAGIDLHAAISSSNLTDEKVPASAPVVTPEQAPPCWLEGPAATPPVVDVPSLPVTAPVVDAMPDMPATPPVVAVDLPEPMRLDADLMVMPAVVAEDDIVIRIPHRGDSPMMQHWKWLGLQTILAGALTVAPASAADQKAPEPNKDDIVVQSLADLKKSIELLNDSIKNLKSDTLNADLKATKAQADVDELRKQFVQLQKDLDDLRKTVSSRTSFSIQPNGKTVTGRLRLINTFTDQVTIIVNGKAYRVMPGETRMEAVPAGTFTYEVLGIQGPRSPALAANETFTINVHTR